MKKGGERMVIHEIAAATGLSKKAIRFYEEKGLLRVQRGENGYRVYTNADVDVLQRIKLLRLAGVTVADIQLLFDDIISIDELLLKRRAEIEQEYGEHSLQFRECCVRLQQYTAQTFDMTDTVDEMGTEQTISDELALGVDIGTTTISAVVLDMARREQVESYTIPNKYTCKDTPSDMAEQDAEAIAEKVLQLVEHLAAHYRGVRTIGVTGQMHGILYVDENGRAVSRLMTWQDHRAQRLAEGEDTYCRCMERITGQRIAAGYGLATHWYNLKNGLVPPRAHTFCSIMDYVVMRLTQRAAPLVHTSVASSFGLFDASCAAFDTASIKALGMAIALPDVTDDYAVCGRYGDAAVAVAIGDNQASVLGAVRDVCDSVLVNIGTGSQISLVSRGDAVDAALECRPLVKDVTIVCGSALCGGAAYALLERFFRNFMQAAAQTGSSQYDVMNALAQQTYRSGAAVPQVDTCFYGKRHDTAARGAIHGITGDNFTPGGLIVGFLVGMCRELHDFYRMTGEDKKTVVASGNAVRKIPVLRDIIADVFGLPVCVPLGREEASVGTALFAAVAAGHVSPEEIGAFVAYDA